MTFMQKKKKIQNFQGLLKHLAKVPSLGIQCTTQIDCESWERPILTPALPVRRKSIHYQLSYMWRQSTTCIWAA